MADGTGRPGDAEVLAEWRAYCRAEAGHLTFRDVFACEVAEAFCETSYEKLREELLQVVSVGLQWVEALDRREAFLARRLGEEEA